MQSASSNGNKKYLKRFILIFLMIVLLFLSSALFISWFYKNKVKDIFLSKINTYLQAETSFSDFNLSLLEKFPNASFQFYNVITKDATLKKKDTLLKAKTVYLQFNIFDLIDKKYIIKNIEVQDGFLRIVVYQDGSDNYHCWKTQPNKADKSFEIDLKKIVLKSMKISYQDYSNDQDYSFLVKRSVVKGKFSEKQYTLNVEGKTFFYNLNSGGVNYIKNKSADLNFTLNADNDANKYQIKEGTISIGKLLFDAGGYISTNENNKHLDLRINGHNLNLQSFIDEFPEHYQHYFSDYKSSGELSFHMSLKGTYKGIYFPVLNAEFSLSNAEIEQKHNSIVLNNINLKGSYTTGSQNKLESNKLILENFSASLKTGVFKGNFKMVNFVKHEIELNASANINLKDLKEFIKLDTLESLSGNLSMEISFKSILSTPDNFTSADFINSKTTGKMKIRDVKFLVKKNSLPFNDFSGGFTFNNNDLKIEELSGNISKSNFSINGELKNVLSFIFLPNQKLQIKGNLISKNIDLDELLSDKKSENSGSYKLIFSPNLEMDLNTLIDKIGFRKFSGQRLTGEILLKDKKLSLNSVKVFTMNGSIDMSGIIDASNDKNMIMKLGTTVSRVDISRMFYQLENFGQTSLSDKNIKGVASADITFSSTWSPDLKVDLNSIYSKADITIEDGELVNYESLKALSKFVNLNDLMDVKFSTLKNQVEIKNQIISIPSMEIKSNAINISLSGTHTFKNDINYNLKLLLSELLSKKAKKAKKENEFYAQEEDDGLGRTTLYILITGNIKNPIFKYDKKGVKEKIKTDLKKEKQNVKQILKQEWGLFRKDSTVKTEPKNDNSKIKVIWDEKEDE